MTGNEIRENFINYFKKNNHKVIRSSSLIPSNDPTLLFTNAGMVQFKRTFLGEEKQFYNRATSSQKCVRAGGKHNDLENVGYTSRHHTFFEMLGNFSFGDYFKREAIEFAWDLITNVYKLPSDKIWASVYLDDDESYKLWQNDIGIPNHRIIRLGKKENFWSMAKTGPCGPCTELHIDRGKHLGCGKIECSVNCDCDRFIEIWNLVFMQFNRDKLGNLSPLPEPSIDTGLGLERLTSIIQDVQTNFETDLILPIIKKIEILSEIKFGQNEKCDIAMKVISDHSRATAFLIGDGVIPSNDGRGYVLRRIIRRAIRYGRVLNLNKLFFQNTVKSVFKIMEQSYPELKNSSDYILNIVKNEEIRFSETIDHGLKILNENLENMSYKGNKNISGDLIFKLHDTYGFPVDIIRDIAKDKNLTLDLPDFQIKMDQQRQKSRSKKAFINAPKVYKKISTKELNPMFIGYKCLQSESKILAILINGVEVKTATEGSKIELIADRTPFYGESGGQIGDQGIIESGKLKILVKNAFKNPSGIIVHKGKILSGSIEEGQIVLITVNKNRRLNISHNHTATHLLHKILRQELGKHVKQSGSLVSFDKLRFDFTHFSKISEKKLNEIEQEVNKRITENIPIKITKMPIKEAIKSGATALFEEKYGEQVRIVSISNFSKELCGGTHANRTGDIGIFKILSESGIASGIRRIEAITGDCALIYIQKIMKIVDDTISHLKVNSENILFKIAEIKTVNKSLLKKTQKIEEENTILKIKLSHCSANNSDLNHNEGKLLKSKVTVVNGIRVRVEKVEANTANNLRKIVDLLKNEIKSGIIALGCEHNKKALLILGVTKDLTDRFDASKIINEMAKIIGGKGGGRSDLAQAGGNNPKKIDKALKETIRLVRDIK